MEAPRWLTTYIVLLVSTGWFVSLVIALMQKDYSVMPFTSAPLMIAIGYVTGIKVIRPKGNGNS